MSDWYKEEQNPPSFLESRSISFICAERSVRATRLFKQVLLDNNLQTICCVWMKTLQLPFVFLLLYILACMRHPFMQSGSNIKIDNNLHRDNKNNDNKNNYIATTRTTTKKQLTRRTTTKQTTKLVAYTITLESYPCLTTAPTETTKTPKRKPNEN